MTTAATRLRREFKKLTQEPVPHVEAAPLESDILEWRYVLSGPPGTPYAGGLYHGKLLFPPQYPYKPPSIMMCTPSGRFKINTRLCLSMSDFHPETWNPMWNVGSILSGLLSFMLEESPNTVGSIQRPDSERLDLARRSLAFNVQDPKFVSLFPHHHRTFLEQQRGDSSSSSPSSSSSSTTTGTTTESSTADVGKTNTETSDADAAADARLTPTTAPISSSSDQTTTTTTTTTTTSIVDGTANAANPAPLPAHPAPAAPAAPARPFDVRLHLHLNVDVSGRVALALFIVFLALFAHFATQLGAGPASSSSSAGSSSSALPRSNLNLR